jgi:signal transduction histidine kinase/ActR/RegA family two-component response regulator
MPSRWQDRLEGIETTRRLFRADPSLQVVLATAYADYAWEDIHRELGESDRFLILKKPFDALEVRQLASALTQKARLMRAQATRVELLGELVRDRTAALARANDRLRQEILEREAMHKILAHTQRIESIGQLTAGMAHEINNPLAIIRGNLEFLVDTSDALSAEGDERGGLIHEAVTDAIEGTERIARIVRDVMLFASPQDGQTESVDLCVVLEAALALFGKTIERGVHLTRHFAPVPPVAGMPHRLEQVFVNLLSNAVKAFPRDLGRVPNIRVALSHDPVGEVRVEVRDNGEGVPEEDLPRLFDPFFTTRPLGEGTGLGLAVSHGIVAAAGGRIEIESRRGEGTVVRVVLPTLQATVSPAAPAGEQTQERSLRPPLHLLVIDDDSAVLRSIGRTLRRHELVSTTSAAAALLRIANERFDVILCDLMMPEMGGAALVARLRETSPPSAARVVFMTGQALTAATELPLGDMADWWIQKPFTVAEIEELLYARCAAATAGEAEAKATT